MPLSSWIPFCNRRSAAARRSSGPSRKSKPRSFKPTAEALEDRTVPAVLFIDQGVLTYSAASGVNNNLTLKAVFGGYQFTEFGTTNAGAPETIFVNSTDPLAPFQTRGSGTNSVFVPYNLVTKMVRIFLNDGRDTMTVLSNLHVVQISTGTGDDTIQIGDPANSNGGLAGIRKPVNVDGGGQATAAGDLLRITDTGTTARSYTLTGSSVLAGGAAITYANLEQLDVNAANGPDSFSIQGVAPGTRTNVRGGLGEDVFHMGAGLAGLTNSPLSIDGGGDSDWVDYSAFTTGVNVNLNTLNLQGLLASSATGVRNGGLTNVENAIGGSGGDTLIGSGGPNILIGGDGGDILNGADGRDLLIGGLGVDIMNGAGADDILIGGTTDFDTNLAALDAIMAEWTSTHDFNTRVNNIRAGVQGGQFKLDSTTVHDDHTLDAIVGDQDSNWGWIFNTDSFDANTIQQIN